MIYKLNQMDELLVDTVVRLCRDGDGKDWSLFPVGKHYVVISLGEFDVDDMYIKVTKDDEKGELVREYYIDCIHHDKDFLKLKDIHVREKRLFKGCISGNTYYKYKTDYYDGNKVRTDLAPEYRDTPVGDVIHCK